MNFEDKVHNAINEMISGVLKAGEEAAKARFDAYSGSYDLDAPSVTSQQTAYNKGCIVAESDDILFQEFGTGIGAVHPDGSAYGFTPGSWSSTKGSGIFAKYGHWHYGGKDWVGVPPAMAMYEARKAIVMNAERIFKEAMK